MEGLEKERDFYFGKLREVEVLAQDENVEFTRETVLAILYKTDEDGEAGPACSITTTDAHTCHHLHHLISMRSTA